MSDQDRIDAIVARGYTERQARFLVLVMLHSGACTVRQYCQFSGIARGQKSQDFFAKLVAAKHATTTTDANGKLRIFHVFASTLYDAIGEPENRNRRPVPIAAAIERIMLLDAVLACQDTTWLATEREKVAHFTKVLGTRFDRRDLPQLRFGEAPNATTRYFPDKLPIGLVAPNQSIFTFLVRRPAPVDFRSFLDRHSELLRALPHWRLRLLIPQHLARCEALYLNVVREELLTPMRLGTVDELKWFFEEKSRPTVAGTPCDADRYLSAARAFCGPRFESLYRRWQDRGDAALAALSSPTLADAITRGKGEVETHVLSHSYFRLQYMVGTA